MKCLFCFLSFPSNSEVQPGLKAIIAVSVLGSNQWKHLFKCTQTTALLYKMQVFSLQPSNK